MKTLLFITFALTLLQAQLLENLQTFQADFVQTIDDKETKVVKYDGRIVADKKLKKAKWSYLNPIKKYVYVQDKLVTIVEPELEQVTIRKISNDFDLFALLNGAKKIGKNLYEAKYKKLTFKIFSDGQAISKLQYKDNFENIVTVTFKNQKYNEKIDPATFKPEAPATYDLIIE